MCTTWRTGSLLLINSSTPSKLPLEVMKWETTLLWKYYFNKEPVVFFMKIVFRQNHKEPVVFLMKIVFWAKPQRTCCFLMKIVFQAKLQRTCCFFNENCVPGKTHKEPVFSQWKECFGQNHISALFFSHFLIILVGRQFYFFKYWFPKRCLSKEFMLKRTFFFF